MVDQPHSGEHARQRLEQCMHGIQGVIHQRDLVGQDFRDACHEKQSDALIRGCPLDQRRIGPLVHPQKHAGRQQREENAEAGTRRQRDPRQYGLQLVHVACSFPGVELAPPRGSTYRPPRTHAPA